MALDAKTGAVVWTAHTDAVFLEQPSVVGRDVIFWGVFPDSKGCAAAPARPIAFNRLTGELRPPPQPVPPFKPPTNGRPFAVAFSDGTTVRSLSYGRLLAYTKRGRLLWRRPLQRAEFHAEPSPIFPGPGIVLVFENTYLTFGALAGHPSTSLLAVDLATGKTLWHSPDRRGQAVLPTFDSHAVYAFADNDHLRAFEPRTGAILWQAHLPEGAITATNDLLVISSPGLVTALSRAGSKLWSTHVSKTDAFQAPAVANGRVFAPIEGVSGSGCGD